jgi:hypothetical protein
LQLISRIIRRGELHKVLEWGIQPEDFRTGLAHQMYGYLLAYYKMPQSHGSVIGPSLGSQVFPNFVLCDDEHVTTEALCSEVRQYRIQMETGEKLDKIRELLEADPMQACAQLMQLGTEMIQLGGGKVTDIKFGTAFDQALQIYQMRKAGVDFSIARWPWHLLDTETGGIRNDDYVVFYGRPKSYKSWVLFYLAACLFMQGKRLVIYTKEMTWENVFDRIICCIAQVGYSEWRAGKLSYQEEESIYRTRRLIHMLRAEENIIVLSGKDAPRGGDTVPWLMSKVKTYQPHIVIVDGLYLMSDVHRNKDKHARVASISNELRQMNLETRIPILATLQANRQAAKHNEANFDDLAFSDAVGQDATMVARVINEKESPSAMLVLAGAREFRLNGFRINAEPARNFEQYGQSDEDARLTAKDIDKAKEKDMGAEDDLKSHAKKSAAPGMTPRRELNEAIQKTNDYINGHAHGMAGAIAQASTLYPVQNGHR